MRTLTAELSSLVDQTAAAEFLGLSPRSLEGLRQRGEGPRFVKLGKGLRARVRYRRADLEAWVNSHTRTFTGEQAS